MKANYSIVSHFIFSGHKKNIHRNLDNFFKKVINTIEPIHGHFGHGICLEAGIPNVQTDVQQIDRDYVFLQ